MLRMRWIRLEKGLTQRELADKAKLSVKTIESIEQGVNRGSDASMIAIAKALGVAPTRFGTLRQTVRTS